MESTKVNDSDGASTASGSPSNNKNVDGIEVSVVPPSVCGARGVCGRTSLAQTTDTLKTGVCDVSVVPVFALPDEKRSAPPTSPTPPKGEIGSDFVTLYRRCALQEPLKDWALRRMVSTKASGDKFGPFQVRQEAPKAFSSMMNEIDALADYMFADLEKIADHIHTENVDLEQAFRIMHKPVEAPR